MRRAAVLLWTALLLGALTGCAGSFLPPAKDIASVELLRTMAVDTGEGNNIKVTVSTGVQQGGGGKPKQITREAGTLSAACQALQQSGSSYVFFGHVSECVVGEALAKAGVEQVLDYIQRDFEMRMDTPIFLARGITGAELLAKAAGKDLSATDQLQEIGRELPLEERAWPCTVRTFLTDLYDNGYAMMPVVRMEKEVAGYGVVSDGMAIFRDSKLAELLDTETGKGANLLLGQPQAGYVDVTLEQDIKANLKLSGADCRWRPQWTGHTLTGLIAEVQVEADLTEVSDTTGSWEERKLRDMEEQLARRVTAQVKAALREEKSHGDYLHLERQLISQCPDRVKEIRENWDRWLDELTFQTETTATIRQSYDVSRAPQASRGG